MLSARDDSRLGPRCGLKLRLRVLKTKTRQLALFGFWSVLVLISVPDVLSVTDPSITVQPASQHRNIGESVTFSVTATGTAPLQYQWRKDGAPVSQANGFEFSLANLKASDAGSYSVVVSNPFGNAVTSNPAVLVVNSALFDTGFNLGVTNRGIPL